MKRSFLFSPTVICMVLPIGDCSGKCVLANDWLTTTASLSSNPPSTNGNVKKSKKLSSAKTITLTSPLIPCDFTIFPEDFTYNCESVADKLIEIEKYFTIFNQIIEKLKYSISEKTDKKQKLLTQYNLTSWDLKNERLKEIIDEFTNSTNKKESEATETIQIESMFEVEDFDFF